MEKTGVQKLAQVLRVAVIVIFACNLLAFFFVPGFAAVDGAGGLREALGDLTPYERPWELPVRVLTLFALCWTPPFWAGAPFAVTTLSLLACGVCTAVILWQAKRVLDTIIKGGPFTMSNAASLRRAAVCCWVISAAALARLIFEFAYYRNALPLFTYNALFVPVFLVGGLLCMVMSALFRQAAELKAENDLTI